MLTISIYCMKYANVTQLQNNIERVSISIDDILFKSAKCYYATGNLTCGVVTSLHD